MGGYYSQDDIGRGIDNAASASHYAAAQNRAVRDVLLKLYDLLAEVYPAAALAADQKEREREELRMKRGW